MATAVRQVELTKCGPALSGLNGYRKAFVVFRYRDKPVGRILMDTCNGCIQAAELWNAAMACGGGILRQYVLDDLLPVPSELNSGETALPSCSIIVCTRNRAEDLVRCLNSAVPLLGPDVEMIVVDNCPSDDSTRALASQYPVRYVLEPRKGLNWARTRGAEVASGELLLYTDDDVVLDSGWADAMRRPFRDESVGAVTGLVMPLELEDEGQELFEHYCSFSRGFSPKVYSPDSFPPLAAGKVGAGASMALRKSLAARLRPFAIELDAGTATQSGGDNYAFYLLLTAGFSIVYTPDALAWHRHRRDAGEVRRTLYGYGVGVYCFFLNCIARHCDLGALSAGFRWFLSHYFVNLLLSLFRRPGSRPFELAWAEFLGVLDAPLAFIKSRKAERKFRDSVRESAMAAG
jgi:glycosyltransferase involved in cell wall biosynthesis